MAEETKVTEPTADEITNILLRMNGLLILLEGEPDLIFSREVTELILKFNQPELRRSLARRLYHPEEYVSVPKPSSGPVRKNSGGQNTDHHCPHACCNGGGF